MNPRAYRLPTYILPRRYDIALETGLDSPVFRGSVAITLDVREHCREIELHARDLLIAEARLQLDARTLPGAVTLDREREVATIQFEEPLPLGSATLHLSFEGKVSLGMAGLYLASDGPERLLCTQFEATDARAAFPCFDEPSFKAEFAFTITAPVDATVLANGPLASVVDAADNSKTWTFAPSKPMSTYIAALVIGDIASTEEVVVGKTPLRVWALRGKEHMGGFAQAFTERLFPWYEHYFAIPYHFDKYDQVAVPGFSAGAMENSGLVLFRQGLLLMDPATTAWAQEKSIAHVVAHELAHMWFGNLVTMRWWDDLWLNEAFAEWLSIKAVDQLAPAYAAWDDFQHRKAGALATDALETTHSIYSPVATPAEAEELFDSITYIKGCSVLRMLESFLGEEVFRSGVRTYMREFAEDNATGTDLWRHLQNASHEPIADVMQSWITESGHPIIEVRLQPDDSVRIRQRRFFLGHQAKDAGSQQWAVPLLIRYGDDAGTHEARHLLRDIEAVVPLGIHGRLHWCYANADEIGFYRQSFDAELLRRLLDNIDQLTPSEQIGLLRDQWALAEQGVRGMTEFLDVLEKVIRIDNYQVVGAVVGVLYKLEALLEHAADRDALDGFRNWVGQLFRPRLAELGFEAQPNESQKVTQQRLALVDALAMIAQDPAAREQATILADREVDEPSAVDPNLAMLAINTAARFGTEERFERHVVIYQHRRATGSAPQESGRYLQSLPHFREPQVVARVLQLIEQDIVPKESAGGLLSQMLRRQHSQRAAWSYITEHWPRIQALGLSWVSELVEASSRLPAELRDDIVAFWQRHLHGEAQMSYARALETMDQQAEFKARTREELLHWFREHGSTHSG